MLCDVNRLAPAGVDTGWRVMLKIESRNGVSRIKDRQGKGLPGVLRFLQVLNFSTVSYGLGREQMGAKRAGERKSFESFTATDPHRQRLDKIYIYWG
jgi:hypothetical protein